MAEAAAETSSEGDLGPQEPQEATSTTQKQERTRRHRRRRQCPGHEDSFNIYFHRVLKNVHTGLSLSKATIRVMDSFVQDMLERIAREAGHLARRTNRSTITADEIQVTVRLLLPGGIGKHAIFEASRALSRYTERM